MNTKQIQKFVLRYLEATGCHILEKHPAYVTVKLSPAADKSLTNRSYYWSFVERTGVQPETMSFTFVFDPEKLPADPAQPGSGKQPGQSAGPGQLGQPGQQGQSDPNADTILGRYLGITPTAPVTVPGRIPREHVTYGSRRLEQLFQVVKAGGKFVQLFEDPGAASRGPLSFPYTSWLAVNYKIELVCDMKRDELHSLGVDLSTGRLLTDFHSRLLETKLTPRLPPNIYIPRQKITLARARTIVEHYIEKLLKQYDHSWASAAHERLNDELERVDGYYRDLLQGAEEDKKPDIQAQWDNRRQEMEWQYQPRVQASVINCGLFHLREGEGAHFDESR